MSIIHTHTHTQLHDCIFIKSYMQIAVKIWSLYAGLLIDSDRAKQFRI